MSDALKALLTGLIDYAGLFPPARLPLPAALENHAGYLRGADAWMLGRFVCPAARLGELEAFDEHFRSGPTWRITALGRGGADVSELLSGFRADLEEISACRERSQGRLVIDVLEVRLPTGTAAIREALARAAELTPTSELTLFFEAPALDSKTLPAIVRMIRETPFAQQAGFKLRTGGLEAAAFPSCEQVAQALVSCAAEGVPFKATAGLHHPFPRFDEKIPARMHGFINVFVAGVLAHVQRLGPDLLVPVLEDAAPTHFRFDDRGMSWLDRRVSCEDIVRAREKVLSFGSCSFDEPRDDLRELGWM